MDNWELYNAPFLLQKTCSEEFIIFIHTFQINHQQLDLLTGNKLHCVPDLMNDTLPNLRLRNTCSITWSNSISPSPHTTRISSTPCFFNPFKIGSQKFEFSSWPAYIQKHLFAPPCHSQMQGKLTFYNPPFLVHRTLD